MERAARDQLAVEGFAPSQQRLVRSLDLRYRGQAFELNVAGGEAGAALPALDSVEAAFHRLHRAAYGHANLDAVIDLVNARLAAYGLVGKPAGEGRRDPGAALGGALLERRRVWFGGEPSDCPVWERERLLAGAELHGPAIVEEFGATTVVFPGWRGRLDEHGNLRFEREASA
jgi:N-methylhydantoinase A